MTNRQRYALHVALHFWLWPARRIAPRWWTVQDHVWAAMRELRAWRSSP